MVLLCKRLVKIDASGAAFAGLHRHRDVDAATGAALSQAGPIVQMIFVLTLFMLVGASEYQKHRAQPAAVAEGQQPMLWCR